MSRDQKTYKEYDVIYRYKKSILLDGFLIMIFFVPIFFISLYFTPDSLNFITFASVALIWLATNMLSDKIFGGASLGKRIYKIKIVSSFNNGFIPIFSIIHRRYLESAIHPLLSKMNFLEKSKYIDKQTKTKIVKNYK